MLVVDEHSKKQASNCLNGDDLEYPNKVLNEAHA